MKGEDVNSLQPKELIAIEEALTNGQTNLRDKMVMHAGCTKFRACKCFIFVLWNIVVCL